MAKRRKQPAKMLARLGREMVDNFGIYRLGVFEGSSYDVVELRPGKNKYPPHYHTNSDSRFLFMRGEGCVVVGGTIHDYRAGSVFEVPKTKIHQFWVFQPTLMLSIQTPPIKDPKTGKEDIHYTMGRPR